MERRGISTRRELKGDGPLVISVTKVGRSASGPTAREVALEQRYGLRSRQALPSQQPSVVSEIQVDEGHQAVETAQAPSVIPVKESFSVIPGGLEELLKLRKEQ